MQAQVALAQAELALEDGSLHAPFDGIVAAVHVTEEEQASAGIPTITLVDDSAYRVVVSVDEVDVGRLSEGLDVQVTVDALPDEELEGHIERIAPAATFEGGVVYYDVLVELEPTDAPVRSDMTANATIAVRELTDVLLIPTWVVRVDSTTGQTYVDKQVGDDTERVDVTLGARYEGVAQVLDGLSEGDAVVWISTSRFGPR